MSEQAIQQPVVREAPVLYRPRYPEQTVFYQLVRDHFEHFAVVHEERFEASDGPLRPGSLPQVPRRELLRLLCRTRNFCSSVYTAQLAKVDGASS